MHQRARQLVYEYFILIKSSEVRLYGNRNAPINYRQPMPDDRFTLVKMNITRSRIYDYK